MQRQSFKEALKEILTEKELEDAPRSYDVIGDIAIVEIPERLTKKKKQIAAALLENHKNIKVVVNEKTGRIGPFRTQIFEHLAGEKRTTAIHRESGCFFKVDIAKSYFSVREGSERLRIAEQTKDGERILVMFAGVGPFAIIIAKKRAANVVAVEINPDAYASMVENIRLNKVMHHVTPVLGDVKTIVPQLGLFDRVIMPLPQTGHEYLDVAVAATKPGGVVHLYSFQPEEDLWSKPEAWLKDAAKKRKIIIQKRHIVLPFAPRVYKVRVDARIS